MKERILHLLVCPACGRDLRLETFSKEDPDIREGLLECSCGKWFPIIGFVPRLLIDEYRGNNQHFVESHGLSHLKEMDLDQDAPERMSLQVQNSFGAKWTAQPSWGIYGETNAFMREWVFKKYGWNDQRGFELAVGKRKRILDAGTGLGRVAIDCCQVCKEGEVFGIDVSDTVEPAYANTKDYSNAHILQSDLMNLPFRKESFDFIFSEGVLHHTPDTRKSLVRLVEFLAPGGEIAFYLYKKKGSIREFCDDHIRQFTTKLSAKECWEFSSQMTQLGKALSDLKVELDVPEDVPVLGIKAGRFNLQRFFYYQLFKCFWNDRFTFDENNLVNFDWYHPAYASRHTPEEVHKWCDEMGLEIIWTFEDESGMTFRCQKT